MASGQCTTGATKLKAIASWHQYTADMSGHEIGPNFSTDANREVAEKYDLNSATPSCIVYV